MEVSVSVQASVAVIPVRRIMVADVRRLVVDHFGVSETELLGPSRRERIAHVRQIGYYLANTHTRATLKDIARRFGRMDHTTVISGVRRITQLRETDQDFDRRMSRVEELLAEIVAPKIAEPAECTND